MRSVKKIKRVVNGKANCYTYNAQNKLKRILGDGFTNKFVYDSGNRRIALSNHTWRYFIHDGAVPIAEVDSNSNVTRWFVRGVGIADGTGDMIAEVVPTGTIETVHFYLSNHRGDTLMTLTNSGNIETTLRYDAFGKKYQQSGTFTPRYTFSTKEYLSDAILYLYAYRVYDPIAGRWTQRDPIDYQDSENLYQFCGNNPVNGVDELGERWFGAGDDGWTVGRDPKQAKSIINQGSFIGKTLETCVPAMETMSIYHDELTGAIESKFGKIAFHVTNIPTMTPLYVVAVVKETLDTSNTIAEVVDTVGKGVSKGVKAAGEGASKGVKAAGRASLKGAKSVIEGAKKII